MRPDLDIVAGLVPPRASVLDLGCGDGALLEHLIARGCTGRGVEIDPDRFHAAIARGVPVIAADIDSGVTEFEDRAFDVVVLSQTLQATHRPAFVLSEVVRVGRQGIVSFPNFGHWRLRAELALRGRMPSSRALPHPWHDTPNIHLCTLRDFETMADQQGVRIERRILLDERGRETHGGLAERRPNALASGAVYLLTRR